MQFVYSLFLRFDFYAFLFLHFFFCFNFGDRWTYELSSHLAHRSFNCYTNVLRPVVTIRLAVNLLKSFNFDL